MKPNCLPRYAMRLVSLHSVFRSVLLTLLITPSLGVLWAADDERIIDDFEDNLIGWRSPNRSVLPDMENVHEGNAAVRFLLEENANAYRNLEFNDWSDYAGISFWVYSPKATDAVFGFACTSDYGTEDGWSYFYLPIKVDWEGWKHFVVRKEDFKTSRTPRWSQIKQINFSISSWGSWTVPVPEESVTIDDIRLLTEDQLSKEENK